MRNIPELAMLYMLWSRPLFLYSRNNSTMPASSTEAAMSATYSATSVSTADLVAAKTNETNYYIILN